uniref:SH2 domain-containing protein n=1 Tax=Tanacetum cinerariifolium TaxID=118510 RepID=A0A699GY86_TANCI|nr:hypothetical protein [Tanacetum cinerariifolium]
MYRPMATFVTFHLLKLQWTSAVFHEKEMVLTGLFEPACCLYPAQMLVQPDGSFIIRSSTTQSYVVREPCELSTIYNNQDSRVLSEMQSRLRVQDTRTRTYAHQNAFQRYSDICSGSTTRQHKIDVKGTTSSVPKTITGNGKRKVKTCDDSNVFQAYSALCARNVRPRCLSNVLEPVDVPNFSGTQNDSCDVFEKYTNMCDRLLADNNNLTSSFIPSKDTTTICHLGSTQHGSARRKTQPTPPPVEAFDCLSIGMADTVGNLHHASHEHITSELPHTNDTDCAAILVSNQHKRTRQNSQVSLPVCEASSLKRVFHSTVLDKRTHVGYINQPPHRIPRARMQGCSSSVIGVEFKTMFCSIFTNGLVSDICLQEECHQSLDTAAVIARCADIKDTSQDYVCDIELPSLKRSDL